MYKLTTTLFLLFAFVYALSGQASDETIQKWKAELVHSKTDSDRLTYNFLLARDYRFSNTDSSFFYSDAAIAFSKKMGLRTIEALALSLKGATLLETGNLPESMKYQFEAQQICTETKDSDAMAMTLNRIGNIYMELADFNRANDYYFRSMALFKQLQDTSMYYNEISNIGNVYALNKKPDSALFYQQLVYDSYVQSKGTIGYVVPEMMFRMGNAYELKGEIRKALEFYKRGVSEAGKGNDLRNLTMNNLQLARLYFEKTAMIDSALYFSYAAHRSGTKVVFRKGILESCLLLAKIYQHKPDSAVKYLSLANKERDLLFGASRFQDIQRMVLEQQQQQQEVQKERDRIAVRNRTFLLLSVLLLAIILIIYFFNNSRKQKRVNATLHEQRLKISSQNEELKNTLINLKSTQAQLIHSEKMASLGELTAGIAHEIQNPLNFVNNFSDLSKELVDEMNEELEKGDVEEAKFIAADIKSNLEKISHHGKRADSIVRGMLQHSRSSSGEKQETDINKLADEYLRLSYHGLRSKDKDFNADIVTSFDESIGKILIAPQEIGRVILNLVNNAFYAVHEKSKTTTEAGYKPCVSVTTKRNNDVLTISISDNGNGIPDKIKDKIFNPFFTTKPTGQGTGLGLSLSYDIVKAHGGELKVESKEGEGTEFIMSLNAG